MKKLFAALAALFGLSGASASEEVTMIDPKTILFSLATINDALPSLDSRHKPKPTDLILHEDDWRQFELVSRSFAEQVNAEITDIRRIYTDKRSPAGEFGAFTEIHIRKRIPQPFKKPIAWSDFTKACSVSTIVGVAFQGAPAPIANGFSVQLHGLRIYGLREGEKIATLCFDSTQTPALPLEAAERLAAFLEANDMILVHWPSATVFTDKPALLSYRASLQARLGKFPDDICAACRCLERVRQFRFPQQAPRPIDMKKSSAQESLSASVAKGLQAAARIARKRAKETKTPLILWRDGKVVRVRVPSIKSK